MLTLVRGGEVWAPEPLGRRDVLLTGDRIGLIADRIDPPAGLPVTVVEAGGHVVVPGLVDQHVHLLGGGGEGGHRTRTPEIVLSELTRAGITTVVGLLGVDGVTRSLPALLAKARALEEEGLTAVVYTGSYRVPVATFTGDVLEDLVLVREVVGVGEVAIADHRSGHPSWQELARVGSAARTGGLLAGKAGIVNLHVGDGAEHLRVLDDVVEHSELPRAQFLPTHVNRNPGLFRAATVHARRGGLVDLTTSTTPEFLAGGEVACSVGLRRLLEQDVRIDRITFSSDGQGSLPAFDADGRFAGLQVGSVATLTAAVRAAVREEGVGLEDALRVVTANPARVHALRRKGAVREGCDADLALLDRDDLSVRTVIARGAVVVADGVPLVRGTFEARDVG